MMTTTVTSSNEDIDVDNKDNRSDSGDVTIRDRVLIALRLGRAVLSIGGWSGNLDFV